MLAVRIQAIDGTGTFTLSDSQPCRLLLSRQRFSPHGTPLSSIGSRESGFPMSQVVSRCYDFPSRIPGHLFVSLPGSTLLSSVRVSQLALPEGRRVPSGPGSLFNRRPELPACPHVDVSGISQVPRRSILCLCLVPRPRPNRRSLAFDGFVDAAPAPSTTKASAC